ncbi:MAG: hypothetical protein VX528_08260, partial [Candidatus Latescibacterota bacterium]|nr:hypothetical protein [Candidatus Latescibacterota bacterium]
MSAWAGGYSKEFAVDILKGAEKALDNLDAGTAPEGTFVNDTYANFDFMEPEPMSESEEERGIKMERFEDADDEADFMNEEERDEVEQDEGTDAISARQCPVPVRCGVRRAHCNLGHPSRPKFLRMMRFGNCTKAAIEYAKKWKCPICAERRRPHKVRPATSNERPKGFNKVVHVDLKYIRDSARQLFVAMSICCTGSCWHVATLCRTRKAAYVARKFLKIWVRPYGPPRQVLVHDQGGEFQGAFGKLMEELSLPTDVTAAHAGWQLAFGERQGGIMGEISTSVIFEHGLKGRADVEKALIAATMAKNTQIRNHGYSPEMYVFGRQMKWPASVVAEDTGTLELSAMDADGEVRKAAKLRSS